MRQSVQVTRAGIESNRESVRMLAATRKTLRERDIALCALMDQHSKDQVRLVQEGLVKEAIKHNGLGPYVTDMGSQLQADIRLAEEELGLSREQAVEYLRRKTVS